MEGVGDSVASRIWLIGTSRALRIAVDVPSGLDPDTGEDHGLAVKADITIALHAAKPGLLIRKDIVGKLLVEEIGIPV